MIVFACLSLKISYTFFGSGALSDEMLGSRIIENKLEVSALPPPLSFCLKIFGFGFFKKKMDFSPPPPPPYF